MPAITVATLVINLLFAVGITLFFGRAEWGLAVLYFWWPYLILAIAAVVSRRMPAARGWVLAASIAMVAVGSSLGLFVLFTGRLLLWCILGISSVMILIAVIFTAHRSGTLATRIAAGQKANGPDRGPSL